jgi:NinB protein
MVFSYYSNVTNGKLQNNVSQQIANHLKQFNGKRVEIKIQKLKSTRSVQQNRLWWLYVDILHKELGYHKEEMHEILKFKFLKKELVNESTGEILTYIGSTAKLSKSEFIELVDRLIQWSAETFNIILPLPNEQTELSYD